MQNQSQNQQSTLIVLYVLIVFAILLIIVAIVLLLDLRNTYNNNPQSQNQQEQRNQDSNYKLVTLEQLNSTLNINSDWRIQEAMDSKGNFLAYDFYNESEQLMFSYAQKLDSETEFCSKKNEKLIQETITINSTERIFQKCFLKDEYKLGRITINGLISVYTENQDVINILESIRYEEEVTQKNIKLPVIKAEIAIPSNWRRDSVFDIRNTSNIIAYNIQDANQRDVVTIGNPPSSILEAFCKGGDININKLRINNKARQVQECFIKGSFSAAKIEINDSKKFTHIFYYVNTPLIKNAIESITY